MQLADAAEVRVMQQTAAKTKLASQMNDVHARLLPPAAAANGEKWVAAADDDDDDAITVGRDWGIFLFTILTIFDYFTLFCKYLVEVVIGIFDDIFFQIGNNTRSMLLRGLILPHDVSSHSLYVALV